MAKLQWIDFALLQGRVGMVEVLAHIGWEWVACVGDQYRGPCPIHKSTWPRSRSFSVNVGRQCYQCFKCGAHGGPIGFWAEYYRLSELEAAHDMCSVFQIDPSKLKEGV